MNNDDEPPIAPAAGVVLGAPVPHLDRPLHGPPVFLPAAVARDDVAFRAAVVAHDVAALDVHIAGNPVVRPAAVIELDITNRNSNGDKFEYDQWVNVSNDYTVDTLVVKIIRPQHVCLLNSSTDEVSTHHVDSLSHG
jgi:hypothetical protein